MFWTPPAPLKMILFSSSQTPPRFDLMRIFVMFILSFNLKFHFIFPLSFFLSFTRFPSFFLFLFFIFTLPSALADIHIRTQKILFFHTFLRYCNFPQLSFCIPLWFSNILYNSNIFWYIIQPWYFPIKTPVIFKHIIHFCDFPSNNFTYASDLLSCNKRFNFTIATRF